MLLGLFISLPAVETYGRVALTGLSLGGLLGGWVAGVVDVLVIGQRHGREQGKD